MFRNLFAFSVSSWLSAFRLRRQAEWFTGLTASSKEKPEGRNSKATLILPAGGRDADARTARTYASSSISRKKACRPANRIMVVNTADRRFITTGSRPQSSRCFATSLEMDAKASRVLNSDGPQLEIWISNDRKWRWMWNSFYQSFRSKGPASH